MTGKEHNFVSYGEDVIQDLGAPYDYGKCELLIVNAAYSNVLCFRFYSTLQRLWLCY